MTHKLYRVQQNPETKALYVHLPDATGFKKGDYVRIEIKEEGRAIRLVKA